MLPPNLGDVVVQLVNLVDTGLRSIGAEAKRKEAAYTDCGYTCGRCVLGIDVKAQARRGDHGLREHRLEVEPRPVRREVVHQRGAELPHVVKCVLVDRGNVHITEAWNRGAREWERFGRRVLLVDAHKCELVL